ncbi:MAG: LysE family translocator [Amphritea sp.]
MLTSLMSMGVFALVGAISPGPVNIIATSCGANFGFVRALPHVLGATLGYTLVVFLAGAGLNQVFQLYPQLTIILQYLGGGFLLYMSFKIATANDTVNDLKTQKQPPSILQGILAQCLNPKAWLVSISGVSLFVVSQPQPSVYLLAFCIISFVMCFAGVASWAAIGHLIRKYLRNARHRIMFNAVMGLLLSSTVLSIFISS